MEDGGPIYRVLDLLEAHASVVYPIVAVTVLVLLAGGILQAWRSQELRGAAKVELRREIVRILRGELGGMSAEQLSREVHQPPLALVRLLEEMQEDGLVVSHTNTQRLTTWRLKGMIGS